MATPIEHGLNNDQNVIVQLSYDKGGRTTSLRDPRGHLTAYTYDALDRRTSLTNPLNQTWTTSYEDLPDGGSQTTLSHPNGYDVTREFDLLGRLNAINYGEAATTPDVRFFYDASGNRTRMTEYGGAGYTDPVRETIYSYDRVRRLSAVAFDSDGDSSAEQTVTYAYDAGGRQTRLTLPGDRNVRYQYDAKGQLVGLKDWDDQATAYAYDSAGRLIVAERDNGLRSRYVYDAAGRLRILRHSAGERLLGHFAYEVDGRGNRTQALEALPHPATTEDTTLAYDDPGLVVKGSWSADTVNGFRASDGLSARLKLLFVGDAATLTMGEGPDHSIYDVYIGHALWQSFDGYAATAGERQIAITLDGEGPHVLEIRNRADCNLQSSGYTLRFKQLVVPDWAYDAHTIAYEYDALSRLRDARYGAGLNADAAAPDLLRRYQYSYDLTGNRLAETLTVGGAPVTTPYSYNAANQLVSDGTHTLTYDPNGNLTDDGTQTYTWDRANRLLSMGGLSYAYDGLGNRVQQSNGVDVTQYLLDVQPGLAVMLSATTGADTARYVHGPRGIHAQQDSAGAWGWLVQDGLGSVRGVADSTLTLLESRQYAPYGEPYDVAGTPQTTYGFTGEPTDANDLVYLRARYLSPALGVFASRDPFEGMSQRPMSLNGYSYVSGNPINFVDPTGKCEQPTNWNNPFDVNCYYSAIGLAQRFSDGDASAYQAWFNVLIQKPWHELKSIEALGTAADATGSLNQFMRNSSIIPSLFRDNPRLAAQALQQWGCQNGINLSLIGSFGGIGTVGALSGGSIAGGTTVGGATITGAPVVIGALAGLGLGIVISLLFAGTATSTQDQDPCSIEKMEERIANRSVGQIVGDTGNVRPSEPQVSRSKVKGQASTICRGIDIGPSEYFTVPLGIIVQDRPFTDRLLSDGNHRFVARRLIGQSMNEIEMFHLRPSTSPYADLEDEEAILYYENYRWATTPWGP